ncbi:hypothetical protein JW926_03280 [Candidatus Sumerlaeota bacterium]|nr:hypothetical protein [Candidatus Sumerlaeota bacterium]
MSKNIRYSGYYPVYAWTRTASDRIKQLYRIVHSGGTSELRVNHQRVGNGWVYLRTYYFNTGTGGYVEISNYSPDQSGVVIADTIRFGNGMGDYNLSGYGTSGYERELECADVWVWKAQGQGCPDLDGAYSDVSVRPRYAAYMNNSDYGSYYDRIYLSFHSNCCNSRGSMALGAKNDWPVKQQEFAYAVVNEVEADLEALDQGVAFGQDHVDNCVDYLGNYISYGEINNTNLQGEMTGTIIEMAYHDVADDGTYNVDYPDVITSSGGSSVCMTYSGSTEGVIHAATQYSGSFKTVYLGFPFETVFPESSRNTIMTKVLDFLLPSATPTPTPTPNPYLDLSKGLSIYLKLPSGQLDLQLIVRETGGSGPIGANGGTSGALERTATAIRINASSQWQYIYFDIPNETWSAYVTGNGVLNGSWGTLEALSITAVSGDPTTAFTLYVDDIYQGPEQSPSMEKIVDNDDGSPGYTETGTWYASESNGYNGGSYRWANAGQSHTATWDLDLKAAGSWTIYVIYRSGGNRCASTKYIVATSSGNQTVYINQQTPDLSWVSLGTFDFDFNGGSVQIDASGSTGGSVVIADAVKASR